ncbi:MAG: four helix bundle protein [Patescibacteria group bacterium]|nr:four helix bundle protein [Patescibacteria group bacterium]
MTFKKFEDLPIWQERRLLAKIIYTTSSKSNFKDFSLRDQMRRCVVSFSSNIAEGFERGSNKELIQFLYIAKWSLRELRSQSYLALDSSLINNADFDTIISKCSNLSAKTNNFIKYLMNSELTKLRHKSR